MGGLRLRLQLCPAMSLTQQALAGDGRRSNG